MYVDVCRLYSSKTRVSSCTGEPGWVARARVPMVDNVEFINRKDTPSPLINIILQSRGGGGQSDRQGIFNK
jgi:hypothetical protein